ncbi:hypothetical protein EDC96DRAFT_523665 [Choanephora cucurbitarum]|nr:hypothetical protein EDC96DRAFT_523656 [Choanephora cucurbitarum]KAI8337388.1 hypothetical protein EDC96DRAFT_523665 [Choanephora cucurbitarum]
MEVHLPTHTMLLLLSRIASLCLPSQNLPRASVIYWVCCAASVASLAPAHPSSRVLLRRKGYCHKLGERARPFSTAPTKRTKKQKKEKSGNT